MSLLTSALIGIFIISICMGVFSFVFFLFLPSDIKYKNTPIVSQFAIFYLCIVVGCIFYIMRQLMPDVLTSILNGTIYVIGANALRIGLHRRKYHEKIQVFHSKLFWLCLLIMLFFNGYWFHYIYPNLAMRVAVMNLIMATVTISMVPLIKTSSQTHNTINTSKQWQSSESVARICATGLTLLFVLGPMIHAVMPKTEVYVIYTVMVQAFSTHMWLGCLCALLMSDIIHTHYQNSIKDPLTGLYNRRYFMSHIESKLSSPAQTQEHALIMCDLDDFKLINDSFGHKNGDLVLVKFAELLRKFIGKSDVAARIGGEEFAILVTKKSIAEANTLAQKLCTLTKMLSITSDQGEPINLSASFGISKLGGGVGASVDIDTAIHNADIAMYAAKHDGKNQVKTTLTH